MNAIELLERQHREMEALFHDLERTDQEDVMKLRRLCTRLADHFAAHAEIEEQFFYPAVRVGDIAWMVDQAEDEHLEAKKLVVQLMETEAGSADFFFCLAQFKDAVLNHVEEEEGDLLPAAKRVLGREELRALGEEMLVRFEELLIEEPRLEIPSRLEQPSAPPS